MCNINKYFVKSIFSGWHEVDKEHYEAFVKHLREYSTNIPDSRKDDFIASKTKVIEKGGITMKFYDGKHIVMRDVTNGIFIEKYIKCKDGVIYLQTYMNFVLCEETVIAKLS